MLPAEIVGFSKVKVAEPLEVPWPLDVTTPSPLRNELLPTIIE
jgi:hypothetical protein